MKKLVEVIEVENEGFTKLLGETVTFYCANYIYHGVLTGINETCLLIKNPSIIYDTGPHDKDFENIQSMHMNELYINKSFVESFGVFGHD